MNNALLKYAVHFFINSDFNGLKTLNYSVETITSGRDGFAYIRPTGVAIIAVVSNTNNVIVHTPFCDNNGTGWHVKVTDEYLNTLNYTDVTVTIWYAENI